MKILPVLIFKRRINCSKCFHTMGIVHVKCRKCKLEEPLNLAYFRRIYRNQGQTNPFHIGSIRR